MVFFEAMTKVAPSPLLSIGALARETGVSVRSIRHYEAQGILSSIRASNGYRLFPHSAVTQVRRIQQMTATGFSVSDIRSFPECMRVIEGARNCSEADSVARRRLASIERQLDGLERRPARLLRPLTDGVIPPFD
ncbi:MAG TPA: MerR family transcriptional regulator [Burkholderiaceae bacterium]|nr:MerR family transcriptional regulator [Burkholderiaceae bacterium]